ncbi:hypothetical protein TL16_g07874 [Triparma laevis f. inornata]|uniref:Uncharacterized protein n=1 Tax=Triparma laevis f. inornata TaxID=1714386 RepID=A0A9W7AUL6_9STRA|nr:hypothetical protein TL16_g07874 [Triparma laevis f. inornata]
MKVGKSWINWMSKVSIFREEASRLKIMTRVVLLKIMGVRKSKMSWAINTWKEMINEWNSRRVVVKRFFGMVLQKELRKGWRKWWRVVGEDRMEESRRKNVREFDRYQDELVSLKNSASKIILMVIRKNCNNRIRKYLIVWKKSIDSLKRAEYSKIKTMRNIVVFLRSKESSELGFWFVKWRSKSDSIEIAWRTAWYTADAFCRRRVMCVWIIWRDEVFRMKLVKKAVVRTVASFKGRMMRDAWRSWKAEFKFAVQRERVVFGAIARIQKRAVFGAWSLWKKNTFTFKAHRIGAKIAYSLLCRVLRRATLNSFMRWKSLAFECSSRNKGRLISAKIVYSVLARLANHTLLWAFKILRMKTVGGRKILVGLMLRRTKDLREWRLRRGLGRWRRWMDFVRRELLLGAEVGIAKRSSAARIARVLEVVVGGELRRSFRHWWRVLRQSTVQSQSLKRISKMLRTKDKMKMADLFHRWKTPRSLQVCKFQACFIMQKHFFRQLRESLRRWRERTLCELRKKDNKTASIDVFFENLKTIRLGHKKERKKIGARLICFLYDECTVKKQLQYGFGRWKGHSAVP